MPSLSRVMLRSAKTVLTEADFTYLGMFRMPNDPLDQNGVAIRFGFSFATMTGRYVNGALRFLFAGGDVTSIGGINQPTYEMSYPGYDPVFASAPVSSLVYNWGDIYQDKRLIFRAGASASETRGFLYRRGADGRDYLWWAYGDSYNASSTSWDPSIGASYLDPNTGVATAYGPWRTSKHSQQTRGYMLQIPTAFATQYLSGQAGFTVGGPITSGNASSPWGPAVFSVADLNPQTLAPDAVQVGASYTGLESQALSCHTLALNAIGTPAARDTNYIPCGWNVIFDDAQGCTIASATPVFQSIDQLTAAVWIDLPTRHGVLMLGQLIHDAPGASQLPHAWYGPGTCCHGRVDPNHTGQGDSTDSMVPYWWIYNPDDLGQVALGNLAIDAVTPTSTISRYALFDEVDPWFYFQGGAWFDDTTSRLYVATYLEDRTTNHFEPRPIVRVFSVNG